MNKVDVIVISIFIGGLPEESYAWVISDVKYSDSLKKENRAYAFFDNKVREVNPLITLSELEEAKDNNYYQYGDFEIRIDFPEVRG
ncbi:MAG: hypothetical protein WCW65_03195 [Candidatus Paceibacterota bacterium]